MLCKSRGKLSHLSSRPHSRVLEIQNMVFMIASNDAINMAGVPAAIHPKHLSPELLLCP